VEIDDTIAATATAPGAAGIAVVRVSGSRALAIAAAVFEGADLERAPANTIHHGWARWPATGEAPGRDGAERRIDEVVAAVFRAPRSYTREDVVEISCHGGAIGARDVLDALLRAGARAAGPGEFTLRAFLRGRLDLVQAEAVADLVAADSRAAHALALSQLRGALSRALSETAEALRDALADVEARVDFAEDVGGVEVPPEVVADIERARATLDGLLAGAPWARAMREGVHVALVGRPNAGKSSVFNALLGERRAIVAASPGTTRDLVSEAIELDGVRVTLSDTAGLRSGGDEIESEGVERARAALERSAAVLWVLDGAAAAGEEDRRIARSLAGGAAAAGNERGPGARAFGDTETGRVAIVVVNKRDLAACVTRAEAGALLPGAAVVEVSALRGDGIADLRAALAAAVAGPRGFGAAVANPRHVEALQEARAALERAAAAAGAPGEIVALELREALRALGSVTGETADEDLLDRIFRRFCVGK
jgi:tRNA modification GTPase